MKHEFYNPRIENAAGYFLYIVNSVLHRTQMALVCVLWAGKWAKRDH